MDQHSSPEPDPTTRAISGTVYSPLPLVSQSEFRIITLAPGQESDPLGCQLEVHSVENPPPYEALSYVWGPPHRSIVLRCNGGQILITGVLDRAMRRIRHPTRHRTLWVDQICINQDDLQERAQQVQIMRRIYAAALTVISWLGSDEGNLAPVAKQLLSKMSSCILENTAIRTTHFPTDVQLGAMGLPLRRSTEWEAVGAFFDNEYFKRLWILQEVRSASRIAVIWGDTIISWDDVTGAFECGLACRMMWKGFDGEVLPSLRLPLTAHPDFRKASQPLKITALLNTTRSFGASDPRDRIFALTGLAEEMSQLEVDYRLTVGEVYAKAAKHIIRLSKDL